jgi:RimJ/RimL family protein N-acetyltransferase
VFRNVSSLPVEIRKSTHGTDVRYEAVLEGEVVHRSIVSWQVLLARRFGFGSRPVIGYSMTKRRYRGKGIYPHVLSSILRDLKTDRLASCALIIVGPDNVPSIRGIEKAGFHLTSHLRGWRMGPFIFKAGGPRSRSNDRLA